MIKLPLVTPPGFQRYDCTGCGDCCRGRFAILISQEDRDRIEKQGWTDEELNLGSQPLFKRRGDQFQLAHRPDGACVFLQEDNLCRIHARHGEPAKPLACRLYPFRLIPLGDEVRVDVRFDCPATSGNLGRPIADHRKDLQKLMGDAVPEDGAGTPDWPLFEGVRMGWPALRRVTETFERVLLDVSLDITRRVTACVNLAALLSDRRVAALREDDLDTFLDEVAGKVQEAAIQDPLTREPLHGAEAKSFRQLVSLYARIDQVGERSRTLDRLKSSFAMLRGSGAVPRLREGFPTVDFAGIEAPRGVPAGAAAQSIERYLHVHLAGMGFFGPSFYRRSYLAGIGSLLLTFPLACWFARAYAVEGGMEALDQSCVERALMIVDHQHGTTPLLNIPTERVRTRMLSDRAVLRSLVIWYGT
ncbi:MAG: YkgJ family cysteine cluster protein [Capsulimonadaceae bacterium]